MTGATDGIGRAIVDTLPTRSETKIAVTGRSEFQLAALLSAIDAPRHLVLSEYVLQPESHQLGCEPHPKSSCADPQTRQTWSAVKIINIQAAKTHLSRFVEEAAAGEEIIVAKAGRPMVRLVPFSAAPGSRKFGALKGQIWESPDCWDPDPELERLFYEGDDFTAADRVAENPS